MKRKNIAIIATMILSASLMACGTSNTADTTNKNVKVAAQSATTLQENQTEKPVVTATEDTTVTVTESTSTEADVTDTEAAITTENTDINNTVDITSGPDMNVESNESDYEASYEPDTPAYVPDTAPADTPVDIPDSTPTDEPVDNTPAPTEPAAHEHNWVPVYGYIEWIENETGEDTHRRYIDENGNEVVITKHDFGNEGWLIDHYECKCGETKTGEDHEKIENYKNTKQISKDGLFYYKTTEEFSALYKNTQRMKENLIS